jgi:hypothetical protein
MRQRGARDALRSTQKRNERADRDNRNTAALQFSHTVRMLIEA